MRYQLIHPIQYDNAVAQILANRGIPDDQMKHYLNTTDDDINEPEEFGEDLLSLAATRLCERIQSNADIMIVVDCDCDGYTSSALLINYLYNIFPSYTVNHIDFYLHDGKQHGLNDCVDHIINNHKDYSLVILPDAGSNDVEECQRLVEKGILPIIFDHHIMDIENPYAIIINSQFQWYPNKELSGVGVTWQFCRYLDKLLGTQQADEFLDLVALGNMADMMSLLSLETKHLINKGFKEENIKNPFITYLAEKNKFSLGNHITPMGAAFYIAPFVNAIVRSGTLEEKYITFKSMLQMYAFDEIPSTKRGHKPGDMETVVTQAIRVVTNVKARQTKTQDSMMAKIEQRITDEHMMDHKVLLFLMEPGEIDKNIAGLVANKIMAKYQRPVCILTKGTIDDEIVYQGSCRGCDKVGVNNFKTILDNTGLVVYATGHEGAFGTGLPEKNIEAFIQATDEALKDMPDEPVYYVDYIYQGTKVNADDILSIAELEDLWGKDMDEPFIAIEGITIDASMVTIYKKTDNTLKISLPNGMSIMKFKATDEECELFQEQNTGDITLNIIGKCKRNEWNGNITPQIFIDDFELVKRRKWVF